MIHLPLRRNSQYLVNMWSSGTTLSHLPVQNIAYASAAYLNNQTRNSNESDQFGKTINANSYSRQRTEQKFPYFPTPGRKVTWVQSSFKWISERRFIFSALVFLKPKLRVRWAISSWSTLVVVFASGHRVKKSFKIGLTCNEKFLWDYAFSMLISINKNKDLTWPPDVQFNSIQMTRTLQGSW